MDTLTPTNPTTPTPLMRRLWLPWPGRLPVLILALSVVLPLPAVGQEAPAEWIPPPLPAFQEGFPELRSALEERIARHRGVVGVVVLDSRSGEMLSIRGDEPFPSASVVKLPILYELALRVREGDLSLDDPLVMLSGDRVGGSGILQHLSPPTSLPVRDVAFLMIALSDNTATNLILEKLGPRSVGERMAALGLDQTRVFRKVFGDARDSFDPEGSERWGLGVTTPMDIAKLLAWVHREEAVAPGVSRGMLRMLDAQHYRHGLPRELPGGTRVAHKTGSVSRARHDCGIVFGPEREYVLCVMTRENEDASWTADNEAEGLIADLSRIVFEALNSG